MSEIEDSERSVDVEARSNVGGKRNLKYRRKLAANSSKKDDETDVGHRDLTERLSVPGDGESRGETDDSVEGTGIRDRSNQTSIESYEANRQLQHSETRGQYSHSLVGSVIITVATPRIEASTIF